MSTTQITCAIGPFLAVEKEGGLAELRYLDEPLVAGRVVSSASGRHRFDLPVSQAVDLLKARHPLPRISFVANGKEIDGFLSVTDAPDFHSITRPGVKKNGTVLGMKQGSAPTTFSDYCELRSRHEAPMHAWISKLLPPDVITDNFQKWRPPTPWELRHLVGEDSLTGVPGATIASIAGLSPQHFRKHLAGESAKVRHPIAFTAWHFLMMRLGVTRPRPSVFGIAAE